MYPFIGVSYLMLVSFFSVIGTLISWEEIVLYLFCCIQWYWNIVLIVAFQHPKELENKALFAKGILKVVFWLRLTLPLIHFQKIDAQAIEEFYGLTSDISKNSESGYILFYQSRD